MKDEFELKIGPDGTIETIYQEGIEKFAEEMGAEVSTVCRASDVEWEVDAEPLLHSKGWSVRSVANPKKALRWKMGLQVIHDEANYFLVCSADENLRIILFQTREEAIQQEIKHFWELKNG